MKFLLIILSIASSLTATSQKTDKTLQKKIQQMVSGFHGDIGVYIKNLRTGKEVRIAADTVFPTASIVKTTILTAIMQKVDRGELSLESKFIYSDSFLYPGEDILGSFKNGESIYLKKLLLLMCSTSDNTASLWLQHVAGTGTAINSMLDSLGFVHTRVNSRTPGREAEKARYGWGQTTPLEIAALFEKMYYKKLISPEASTQMMRILGRNFWDEQALSAIPPTTAVFSKNGCVDASRSEVMLVNAENNPYIFCVFTKNNADRSWTNDNEAWKLTSQLSALVWQYYGNK